jgi:polyisoprenoid-binding protein YceI
VVATPGGVDAERMLTAPTTLFETGTWHVDPARSYLGFAIRHLRVATVRGRFGAFSGELAHTGDGLRIAGWADTASVDTGDGVRDERLRSGFFLSDEHPLIELGVRCTEPAPGADWMLGGTLSIRGVTRPVVLRAVAEPLRDGEVRVVLAGTIKRSEFGLDWEALRDAGRLLVGDKVQISAGLVLTASEEEDR